MTSTIRIGLIGCGQIARRVHLKNLIRIPSCEVTSFADLDSFAREEVQRIVPGATAFSEYVLSEER